MSYTLVRVGDSENWLDVQTPVGTEIILKRGEGFKFFDQNLRQYSNITETFTDVLKNYVEHCKSDKDWKLVWNGGNLTPYQLEGWTINTKFKVVANESDHNFCIGEIVELLYDDSTDMPFFKKEGESLTFEQCQSADEYDNLYDCFYFDDLEAVNCLKPLNKISCEEVQVNISDVEKHEESVKQRVKSDGGSSSYYFTELPQHMIDKIVETKGIEIKDIVRYCFDNDSDCKDIIKALKRIREYLKGGGKEGADPIYDSNKIKFFANELSQALNNDFIK